MATPNPVYERFGALHRCVGELHARCKLPHSTVASLIDTFYHFHGLASAFRQDCETYLFQIPASTATQEFRQMVSAIDFELKCSIVHIQAEAERLNTTILEEIREKLCNPSRPLPVETLN